MQTIYDDIKLMRQDGLVIDFPPGTPFWKALEVAAEPAEFKFNILFEAGDVQTQDFAAVAVEYAHEVAVVADLSEEARHEALQQIRGRYAHHFAI